MVQENDAQRSIEPKMSAYPDLDYIPSFPWLGQSRAGHDVHHADPTPQSEGPVVGQSFASEDPDHLAAAVPTSFSAIERFESQPADCDTSPFGTDVFGDQSHTSRNPKDISSDPDFHLGEDNDMYALLVVIESSS